MRGEWRATCRLVPSVLETAGSQPPPGLRNSRRSGATLPPQFEGIGAVGSFPNSPVRNAPITQPQRNAEALKEAKMDVTTMQALGRGPSTLPVSGRPTCPGCPRCGAKTGAGSRADRQQWSTAAVGCTGARARGPGRPRDWNGCAGPRPSTGYIRPNSLQLMRAVRTLRRDARRVAGDL